ncbi:hypothetical protein ACILG0_08855 [Pseudomonadota bacterium AL_CKDN230030165-1A_HGKHYDSX7]
MPRTRRGDRVAARRPTDTDPFDFVAWVRGEKTVLVRNEGGWAGPG